LGQALAQRAFTELGVSQIVATTMVVYIESRRVLEKAALTYVRTVYLDWLNPLQEMSTATSNTGWPDTTGHTSEIRPSHLLIPSRYPHLPPTAATRELDA
jgi:hypothetical protein